jgi:hypothetical protein
MEATEDTLALQADYIPLDTDGNTLHSVVNAQFRIDCID